MCRSGPNWVTNAARRRAPLANSRPALVCSIRLFPGLRRLSASRRRASPRLRLRHVAGTRPYKSRTGTEPEQCPSPDMILLLGILYLFVVAAASEAKNEVRDSTSFWISCSNCWSQFFEHFELAIHLLDGNEYFCKGCTFRGRLLPNLH